MSRVSEEELEDIESLFVQSATGLSSSETTITLHGVSQSTLYFADRPKREVGYITSRRFVELWDEGDNSFADDPPNGVVAFLEPIDAPPQDAVVVLRDPQMEGDSLTYTVDVLEGPLPATTGACSLFIDPLGRPLSPGSVAGVRRRERRRMRRR